jgi:hypothetical protein
VLKYITEVTVLDPDSNGEVTVEIWKCTDSGGIFGIDASFAEQVGTMFNPFNGFKQEIPDTPDTPDTPEATTISTNAQFWGEEYN